MIHVSQRNKQKNTDIYIGKRSCKVIVCYHPPGINIINSSMKNSFFQHINNADIFLCVRDPPFPAVTWNHNATIYVFAIFQHLLSVVSSLSLFFFPNYVSIFVTVVLAVLGHELLCGLFSSCGE